MLWHEDGAQSVEDKVASPGPGSRAQHCRNWLRRTWTVYRTKLPETPDQPNKETFSRVSRKRWAKGREFKVSLGCVRLSQKQSEEQS